jgi:hypothetical protein
VSAVPGEQHIYLVGGSDGDMFRVRPDFLRQTGFDENLLSQMSASLDAD